MIAVYLGLLLAWTLVCCLAGAVWEAYWEDVRDMDQRDQVGDRNGATHGT